MMNKERQLGYLSRKVNETVAPWMDDGFDLLIEVVNVTGGEGVSLGTQHLGRKEEKSA